MGKTKAKKPTLDQKKLITAAGYAWKDLLVLEETEEELRLVWRGSGKTLVISKAEVQEGKASGKTAARRKNAYTRISSPRGIGKRTKEEKRC